MASTLVACSGDGLQPTRDCLQPKSVDSSDGLLFVSRNGLTTARVLGLLRDLVLRVLLAGVTLASLAVTPKWKTAACGGCGSCLMFFFVVLLTGCFVVGRWLFVVAMLVFVVIVVSHQPEEKPLQLYKTSHAISSHYIVWLHDA